MVTDLPDLADVGDLIAALPDGGDEARAEAKVREASARFRAEVRHPVSRVEGDEVTLDGDGSRTLLLPAAPVEDVASVEVDDVAVDVDWSTAGVLRRRVGRWPDRLRAVKVTYTHGYDPVPDEIAEAVLAMARYLMGSQPGVSMMQVGGQMVQSSGMLVDTQVTGPWETVVAAYRLNRGDDT